MRAGPSRRPRAALARESGRTGAGLARPASWSACRSSPSPSPPVPMAACASWRWSRRLVTVAVPPDRDRPGHRSRAGTRDRSTARAARRGRDCAWCAAQELLPLLPSGTSDGQLLAALPLPRLIELALDPAAAPDRAAIAAAWPRPPPTPWSASPAPVPASAAAPSGGCGCWAGPAVPWPCSAWSPAPSWWCARP